MTALPARLFGEVVRGWSIRAGRVCHVILGEGRAACGHKIGWGPSVPTIPVGHRGCRTCIGWLPPGSYDP